MHFSAFFAIFQIFEFSRQKQQVAILINFSFIWIFAAKINIKKTLQHPFLRPILFLLDYLPKFFNRLILINETTHPILRERWLKPASNCLGHRSISRKISHWPHVRLRSKTRNLSLVWNPSRIGYRCLICCCWIEHCLQCQCLG